MHRSTPSPLLAMPLRGFGVALRMFERFAYCGNSTRRFGEEIGIPIGWDLILCGGPNQHIAD